MARNRLATGNKNRKDPAAAVDWLPAELPRNCKIIVSTTEVPSALQRARLLEVSPFLVEEAGQALTLWLERAQRTL